MAGDGVAGNAGKPAERQPLEGTPPERGEHLGVLGGNDEPADEGLEPGARRFESCPRYEMPLGGAKDFDPCYDGDQIFSAVSEPVSRFGHRSACSCASGFLDDLVPSLSSLSDVSVVSAGFVAGFAAVTVVALAATVFLLLRLPRRRRVHVPKHAKGAPANAVPWRRRLLLAALPAVLICQLLVTGLAAARINTTLRFANTLGQVVELASGSGRVMGPTELAPVATPDPAEEAGDEADEEDADDADARHHPGGQGGSKPLAQRAHANAEGSREPSPRAGAQSAGRAHPRMLTLGPPRPGSRRRERSGRPRDGRGRARPSSAGAVCGR